MGLDQFAFKTKAKFDSQVDFQAQLQDVETEELHYWRKHPNLHGWMEQLYREKGGTGEQFNCDPVQLTQEDIDDLANSILDGSLPSTSGFFFGQSIGDQEEESDDLQFCRNASEAIKEGYTVYYDSWW
jgi:hypothetical protein